MLWGNLPVGNAARQVSRQRHLNCSARYQIGGGTVGYERVVSPCPNRNTTVRSPRLRPCLVLRQLSFA